MDARTENTPQRSVISAGVVISALLKEALACDVIPVVLSVGSVKLPCAVYRVSGLENTPAKGVRGSDMALVEIACMGSRYSEAVELAERVRAALENRQSEINGLKMRSCTLADIDNTWADDAYEVLLTFAVRM